MRDDRAEATHQSSTVATAIAQRAAELLPEPPAAHDCFGFLAWEELVLSTARRLQPLLDDVTLMTPLSCARVRFAPVSGRLDAESLLALAVLLVHADDAACGGLLSEALADTGDDRSVLA